MTVRSLRTPEDPGSNPHTLAYLLKMHLFLLTMPPIDNVHVQFGVCQARIG